MTLYRRQESRPSPRKINARKVTWLSEEALQIAEEKREAKSKKKKIYPSECRVAKNSKETLLSEHCKEIEGNNRMGNTRDLFKKIRKTKGIFNPKMSTIKDRNGMDMTEAEEVKRWEEYIKKKKKSNKDLNDPVNHDDLITHLEPDILE